MNYIMRYNIDQHSLPTQIKELEHIERKKIVKVKVEKAGCVVCVVRL